MRAFAIALLVLLVVPPAGALHQAPSGQDEVTRVDRSPRKTWRAAAFQPDGSALLVGGWEEDNASRSLVARWTPEAGLEEVYNRSGPPLVDVDVRDDGTSLVVGLRDTILWGEPGSYRNVWNESRFAGPEKDFTFYGLGAAFAPGGDFAIASGSSLLRVEPNGSLEVVHGGEGAFFRSIDFNPTAGYALVEAAVEREGEATLGTIWRTNGVSNLTQEDNVAIYGRFSRGNALLNAVSFAPNGTFATFAGRDGSGASFLTWSPDRSGCHRHSGNGSRCHDHTYRYMGASKPEGPVTCVDWHPSGRYALVTGLGEDVLGYADTRLWAPLVHQGPELLGCAFAPDGSAALAVGRNGTVLRIDPGTGPLVRVLDPKPGRLTPPNAEQRFLVGVLDRSERGTTNVTGHVAPNGTPERAGPRGPWWTLGVNTSGLDDGRHHLALAASGPAGNASLRFPFLVNNEAFQPDRPMLRPVAGLEGTGRDTDGLFTIRWEPLDEPVVYEVEERSLAGGANTSEVVDAGSSPNATVRVHQDGTYEYRVRARNTYAVGNWSPTVSVEVVLDSDGDGVPDERDPQPHTRNQWGDADGDGVATDVELRQCSDPYETNSTPTGDDDGDGIPNGIECEQGTDPRDPDDPPDPGDGEPEPANNTTDRNRVGEPGRDAPAPAGLAAVLLAVGALLGSRRER